MILSAMKYNIVIVTAGLSFNGNTDNEKALGGSETALINVARQLGKLGHKVRVFCNCDKPGQYGEVLYYSLDMFGSFITNSDCDILIVSRHLQILQTHKINSKLTILWNHDILADRTTFMGSIWHFDYIYVLSEFQKKQYQDEIQDLKEPFIKTISNGIDFSLVPKNVQKKHQIMFTSRPERGLYKALQVYEQYGDKTLRLLVCNYETIDDPNVKEVEKLCSQKISQLRDMGFTIDISRFPKKELYQNISESKAVLYPSDFPEIFCISAIEAQACGTSFITTDDFALKEVVLYDRCQPDKDKYVQMLMKVLRDDDYRHQLEKKGLKNARKYSWGQVAQQFIFDAEAHFKERSKDTRGIIQRLIYDSDLIQADEAMQRFKLSKKDFPETAFIQGVKKQDFKEIYEDSETFETADFSRMLNVPRMRWLSDMVKSDDAKSVLSWGCHNGVAEIHASNENPDCEVVGYDISEKVIKSALKLRNQHANNMHNIMFTDKECSITSSNKASEGKFDAVFLGEILEHVVDPYEFIEKMESYVKPGGKMYITIPRGAWEYLSHEKNIKKKVYYHLHHFDRWDVENMFEDKPDFELFEYHDGNSCGYYEEPIGNYLIKYTVDGTATGKRNLERKLLTCRPYQTISACIIARDADNSIERLLESIHFEMDEIVIGIDHNEGECDEFIKRISRFYKVKWFYLKKRIVADSYGFSNARNETIDRALGKWVLWIDTDEQLIKQNMFRKFLDTPFINAYVILQQHPQLDHFLEADKPQRLFRRDKGRFFGYVHEQVQCPDDFNEGINPSLIVSNCHILNFGELHEKMRREKALNRNLELLKVDAEENVKKREKENKKIRYMTIVLIMRDYVNKLTYSIERYGTVDNEETHKLTLPTIRKLYNKYFKLLPNDNLYKQLAYSQKQNAFKIAKTGEEISFKLGKKTYTKILEQEDYNKLDKFLKTI